MSDLELPEEVLDWLMAVFAECDRRIVEKLHNNPNLPEESLDLTWIEHLSRHSSPTTVAEDWTAKIESHFLGGLRHFLRWEIADIGVLLFVRSSGTIQLSKVALLQSKRLYPSSNRVVEEGRIDYEIGFARIADPEDLSRSLAVQHEYEFIDTCTYTALKANSDQVKAIKAYEKENGIPVYYQFYNPWELPYTRRVPISEYGVIRESAGVGTRIVPAKKVHTRIGRKKDGYSPSVNDVRGLTGDKQSLGWTLPCFIVDLFLGCTEGARFDGLQDERVRSLFYRRSGPIAAAISIVIEGP